jgi:hypothetical protein
MTHLSKDNPNDQTGVNEKATQNANKARTLEYGKFA